MISFFIGIIILIITFFYFDRIKKRIKILKNKLFSMISEAILYGIGIFFIFDNIGIAFGLSLVYLVLNSIFTGFEEISKEK